MVRTLAGGLTGTVASFSDGTGSQAGFNQPYGVTVDASGNTYVADRFNHRVRKVSPGGGAAMFSSSRTGQYSSRVWLNDLRRVLRLSQLPRALYTCSACAVVTTFAGSGNATFGDGAGSQAGFNQPISVTCDTSGNVYVVAYETQCVRKISTAGGAPACVHMCSCHDVSNFLAHVCIRGVIYYA